MACIALIVNTDGSPVDQECVRALLDVPPYARSAAHAMVDGSVGLGFVSFSGASNERDCQPGSLGRLRAVMDGRLDDRRRLVDELRQAGVRADLARCPDVDLILHACETWGADCTGHLLGDFAFCVWDAGRRQILCGRDHFGVKPLYVAQTERTLVAASSLDAIRRHTGAGELNAAAIGDLLLFGVCAEPSRTAFSGISRLPPAHRLVWAMNGETPRVDRYWSMQPGETIRYRDSADYLDQFSSLLHTAVEERLGSGRVAVLMSGGLDSSSIATVAAECAGPSAAERVRACTLVYESMLRDEERHYSSLVAGTLGIDISHVEVDAYEPFERWNGDARPPEPSLEALTAVMSDVLDHVSLHADVLLSGDGGDPMLLPSTVFDHVGRVPTARLAGDLLRVRSMPPVGLRAAMAAWMPEPPAIPAWLSDDLLRVLDPRARWQEVDARRRSPQALRHVALNDVTDPWWTSGFESLDPAATRRPVEVRYAFFDVRLASFLLRLPSFPWCLDKQIVREAMRGRLPEAVRTRAKTPLSGSPVRPGAQWPAERAARLFEAVPAMQQFVDIKRFRATVHHDSLLTDQSPGTWAAISLAMWLQCDAGLAVEGAI